ncbi:MAG: hypothetical protein K6B45_08650 [Bacteroidaceae bacterium]|nr:hypothetical protein [Bacteroidaceae bacterium]
MLSEKQQRTIAIIKEHYAEQLMNPIDKLLAMMREFNMISVMNKKNL